MPARPPRCASGMPPRPWATRRALAIDPQADTFTGEIRMRFRVNRTLPVVWMNATRLTIESTDFRQGDRAVAVEVVPGRRRFRRLRVDGCALRGGRGLRHHPLSGHGGARQHPRDLPAARGERLVRGLAVRGRFRAPRVSLLRRAGMEDAMEAHPRRAGRERGGEQHAQPLGERHAGALRLDAARVRGDPTPADLPRGARRGTLRRRRWRNRRAQEHAASLPRVARPRRRDALREGIHARRARTPRGLLRRAVSVRQARHGDHRADRRLRCHGERGHDHLRGEPPPCPPRRGDRHVQAALCRHRRARDRAPVVREPRDARRGGTTSG